MGSFLSSSEIKAADNGNSGAKDDETEAGEAKKEASKERNEASKSLRASKKRLSHEAAYVYRRKSKKRKYSKKDL